MSEKKNIWIYDYSGVQDKLQNILRRVTDPKDQSPNLNSIYESVFLFLPKDVNLYKGSMAVLKFRRVPEIQPVSLGKGPTVDKAIIQGAVFTFIKGIGDEPTRKAVYYSDLIGALFKTKNLLNMSNTGIKPLKNDAQNWETLNITGDDNRPRWYTFAVTPFEISKLPERKSLEMELLES